MISILTQCHFFFLCYTMNIETNMQVFFCVLVRKELKIPEERKERKEKPSVEKYWRGVVGTEKSRGDERKTLGGKFSFFHIMHSSLRDMLGPGLVNRGCQGRDCRFTTTTRTSWLRTTQSIPTDRPPWLIPKLWNMRRELGLVARPGA